MTKFASKPSWLAIPAFILLAACAQQPPPGEKGEPEGMSNPTPVDIQHKLPGTPVKESGVADELPEIAEEAAVFFSLGSASLNYKEKQKLEALAQRLIEDPHQVVTLIGHANDNGSSSYNLAVSDSRVSTVVDFLRSHGVPSGRIRKEAIGGEKTPISCRSLECRQKSRRVDLIISRTK